MLAVSGQANGYRDMVIASPRGSLDRSETGKIRAVGSRALGRRGALIDSAFAQLASHWRKAHAAHDHKKTEELKRASLLAEKQRSKQRNSRKATRHEGIQERQVSVAKRQHPNRRRHCRRDKHADYPGVKKHPEQK